MVATGSPQRPAGRPHIDVSPEEFARRLLARGHRAEEIEQLWRELSEQEPPGRLAGLGPAIALSLGLLLMLAAAVSVLVIYWQDLGAGGILALALVFLAGSLGTSAVLARKALADAADVLEAVAVGWVAVGAYAVERLTDVWPHGASDIDHVHIGMTTMAAAGLVAALALLPRRWNAVLAVPVALALGVLAVDGAELVFGNGLSPRQRVVLLVPLGLAWIGGGLRLDVAGRRPDAACAHSVGLATTAFAVMVLVPKTVPGFTVVGVLGAVALFFSAFVRHWSFTVAGAAGVLVATMSALGMLGGIAPLVIAVAGLALIYAAIRWSRWREAMRAAVLARMPEAAQSFVRRLAP